MNAPVGYIEVQRAAASCNAGAAGQIRRSLEEHAGLLGAVGAYLAACLALGAFTGFDELAPLNAVTVRVASRYLFIAISLPLGFHLGHFIWQRWRRRRHPSSSSREGRPLLDDWVEYRRRHFSVHRFAGLIITCLALAVLLSTFWSYKKVLPVFSPFVWDEPLMRLDRALHLGDDPWALLHPFLGNPAVTLFLDRLYYLWFIFIPVMIAWQGWSLDRRLRSQFLLTYALCWILLGTVLAYWLASAGPCYYGRVTGGPDPFAPLMTYLGTLDARVPLNALHVQDWLWSGYIGQGPFEGISAMPSLHVALPVLYALVGFRVRRWLGAGFAAHAFLTLLGSIHLGWHYAVDGYVSVVAVIVIWRFVGHILDREASRRAALT